ncbi:MAG TPA: universal stress protein [Thermomicrobiales bacterium]|nr:universal stress protein [Thermomicrobiales bacterium]
MFTQVLVPLDGTPQATAALPVAQRLARATGAAVTLARFTRPGAPAAAGDIATAAAGLAAAGLRADTVVAPLPAKGTAPGEIVAAARGRGADLVVMATHARSGLARLRKGSVAEQVLLRCPDAVPAPATAPLATLLVPVDGTAAGCAALDTAAALARATGAAVVLLRVVVPAPAAVEDPLTGLPARDGMPGELRYDQAALDDAQRYVDRLAARLGDDGVAAEGRAVFGAVADTILTMADQLDADLVAISTHGRTGAARTILGSVADTVVRETSRPVLVVRREPPAGAPD